MLIQNYDSHKNKILTSF